ncbi:unnamed protein product, partial [Darwinula stevensoni]
MASERIETPYITIFGLCALTTLLVRSEYATLFDLIQRRLHDVIDDLQIEEGKQTQLHIQISDMFDVKFSKEINEAGLQPSQEFFDAVHYGVHDLIDNLGLTQEELVGVHKGIHQVFADTFVEGGCYTLYAANHTGCLRADSECPKIARGVSEVEKGLVVDLHNQLRAKVAHGQNPYKAKGFQPQSSAMIEMTWDDELGIIAQKWADQCRFENDCNQCRRVARFSVGQNLFFTKSSYQEDPRADWELPMSSWFSMVQRFPHNHVYSYQAGSEWSPYTQMIWGKSYKVGCGYASFKDGSNFNKLYVCNYGPAGNLVGKPVYRTGRPCSRCPRGHVCNGKGLCTYSGKEREELKTGVASPAAIDQIRGTEHQGHQGHVSAVIGSEGILPTACEQDCIPAAFAKSCKEGSVNTNQSCPDSDSLCCTLAKEGEVTPPPQVAIPRVSCPHQCVSVTNLDLCEFESLITHVTIECQRNLCCKLRTAPPSTTKAACPEDYSCIPDDNALLCSPDTTIRNACTSTAHICCKIGNQMRQDPIQSETADCELKCVPTKPIDYCTPGTRIPNTICGRNNTECCQYDFDAYLKGDYLKGDFVGIRFIDDVPRDCPSTCLDPAEVKECVMFLDTVCSQNG